MLPGFANFYPRSPYGERLIKISFPFRLSIFLSTLSLRRATLAWHCMREDVSYFYPRSPYGERHPSHSCTGQHIYFYPRSPYGERPLPLCRRLHSNVFLSTLSLRRATQKHINSRADNIISIHALLTESDDKISNQREIHQYFYPRSPYGERPTTRDCKRARQPISIHALLTESDLKTPCVKLSIEVFLSTLSLRRATASKHA